MIALNFALDTGVATVLAALFVAVSQMWQAYMLTRVHTLVNSNFTEAKSARLAAEASLHTANALNDSLRAQLDQQHKDQP